MKYIFLISFFFIFNLNAQTPPTDTDGDGYKNISNLSQLAWIAHYEGTWDDDYELDNDIDAYDTRDWNDGEGWSPIGNTTTSFTGNFNGNGHVIENLFIDNPTVNYIGFFGKINNTESTISNLEITDIDFTGSDYIGGLVAYINDGFIQNVYVSGTISGNNFIGGIVGNAYGSTLHRVITNTNISAIGNNLFNIDFTS
jgi:hypothetical protein